MGITQQELPTQDVYPQKMCALENQDNSSETICTERQWWTYIQVKRSQFSQKVIKKMKWECWLHASLIKGYSTQWILSRRKFSIC